MEPIILLVKYSKINKIVQTSSLSFFKNVKIIEISVLRGVVEPPISHIQNCLSLLSCAVSPEYFGISSVTLAILEPEKSS